jgi:hypothetical protein
VTLIARSRGKAWIVEPSSQSGCSATTPDYAILHHADLRNELDAAAVDLVAGAR